ncbi:hypothetical protein CRG98_033635 [Punica granatum]|uniref:WAT1-related protein n=1 Tax=Punica granatum TaxID=22663 RepID=A0A2I0IPR3_PUNGR|nr:hypothetical protein CRG98_033635 [Punica granatum]
MAGKAKVAGTLMGIGGAMLLTFYKGVEIVLWSTNVNLLKTTATAGHSAASLAAHQSSDRALGSILAVCSCLCYALWLIIQAKMSESYPAHYSSTTLMSFMGELPNVAHVIEIFVPSPKISIDPSKDDINISGCPSDINVNNTRVSTGDDAQELPGSKVTSQ